MQIIAKQTKMTEHIRFPRELRVLVYHLGPGSLTHGLAISGISF